MKNKLTTVFILLIIGIWGLTASSVAAAPLRQFLIVNDTKSQCGIHWSGDEFVEYTFPKGWRIIEISNKSKDRACTATLTDEKDYFKACCEELGYEYIGKDNIFDKQILKMPYHGENYMHFFWRKIVLFVRNLF